MKRLPLPQSAAVVRKHVSPEQQAPVAGGPDVESSPQADKQRTAASESTEIEATERTAPKINEPTEPDINGEAKMQVRDARIPRDDIDYPFPGDRS
ncbi:MAG: hypothetical protein KDA27_03050 [Candidatus Eisenbacteria bacterium]|uniref:Uncharacterized protein n=1 Tax=Eiseniibacteriota bacterium TaxID=2212470 RepID=A0A956N9E6_UNCEI|nr:hypothetical protein [Candidatus Eisenbacteria bacterium]